MLRHSFADTKCHDVPWFFTMFHDVSWLQNVSNGVPTFIPKSDVPRTAPAHAPEMWWRSCAPPGEHRNTEQAESVQSGQKRRVLKPLVLPLKHVRNMFVTFRNISTCWNTLKTAYTQVLKLSRFTRISAVHSVARLIFRISSVISVILHHESRLPIHISFARCHDVPWMLREQSCRSHTKKAKKYTTISTMDSTLASCWNTLWYWTLGFSRWALLNFKDFLLFGLNSPGISRLSSKKDKECTHTFCIFLHHSAFLLASSCAKNVFLFQHVNPHSTDSLNPPPCTSGNWIACRGVADGSSFERFWEMIKHDKTRSVNGSVLKRADSVYILFTFCLHSVYILFTLCLLCLLLLKRSLTSTASVTGRACQVQGHGSRKDMKRHEKTWCVKSSWKVLTYPDLTCVAPRIPAFAILSSFSKPATSNKDLPAQFKNQNNLRRKDHETTHNCTNDRASKSKSHTHTHFTKAFLAVADFIRIEVRIKQGRLKWYEMIILIYIDWRKTSEFHSHWRVAPHPRTSDLPRQRRKTFRRKS
jgi:hypothetical protein